MWRDIKVLAYREFKLVAHHRTLWIQPIMFFFIVMSLFHFSLGVEQKAMASLAPAAIWVTVLLAVFLSLEHIFQPDYDDGSLEQIVLLPQPLTLILWIKLFVHWLTTGLPLTMMAALYGHLLQLPPASSWALLFSLLLGTLALVYVGSLIAALTIGLQRSSMLIALLALPLYIPPLIFGAQAVSAAGYGLPINAYLALLAALLCLALTLAPPAAAAIIRMILD